MKVLPVLFALLTITFAAFPCCIGEDSCTTPEEEKFAMEQEHECEDQLPCSPFFSCGSCTGFSVLNQEFKIENEPVTFKESIYIPRSLALREQALNRKIKPPRQTD